MEHRKPEFDLGEELEQLNRELGPIERSVPKSDEKDVRFVTKLDNSTNSSHKPIEDLMRELGINPDVTRGCAGVVEKDEIRFVKPLSEANDSEENK